MLLSSVAFYTSLCTGTEYEMLFFLDLINNSYNNYWSWKKKGWIQGGSQIFLPFCDFRSRTAFERAKTDVFRIRTHNVGPLKKMRWVRLFVQTVASGSTMAKQCWLWIRFRELFFSSPELVSKNGNCTSTCYFSVASELSMTTLVLTPAGSWTEWWWRTWSDLTWGSTLLATAGWVRWRGMAFISETCWVAWTPWKCLNVSIHRYIYINL